MLLGVVEGGLGQQLDLPAETPRCVRAGEGELLVHCRACLLRSSEGGRLHCGPTAAQEPTAPAAAHLV